MSWVTHLSGGFALLLQVARLVFSVILPTLFTEQMHYYAHQHILFLRTALSNHQGHGHQCRIGYQAPAVRIVEGAISFKEPEEQGSCDTLVPVDKTGCLSWN